MTATAAKKELNLRRRMRENRRNMWRFWGSGDILRGENPNNVLVLALPPMAETSMQRNASMKRSATVSICPREIKCYNPRKGKADAMKKIKALTMALCSIIASAANAQAVNLLELVKTATVRQVQEAIQQTGNLKARGDHGRTLLMYAAIYNKNSGVIGTILKAGTDVDVRDNFGWTALMLAASANPNPEVTSALLQAGADLSARDRYGLTPLMLAAWGQQDPGVISALLQAGANLSARDRYGLTPLMFAACYNPRSEVITALLQAGADPNTRDRQGLTSLMLAAWRNQNPGVISALLRAGANGKLKSDEGRTAYDYAEKNDRIQGTDAYRTLDKARF